MLKLPQRGTLQVAGIFCLLLLTYHLIFGKFFPLPNGLMGHDYVLTLGSFLDGYLWYRNNGFITPPWFTPSFCGGQAFFADPQSAYYSIPQFITFITDPLSAVYISFILFAGLGFCGAYIYSRNILAISRSSALVVACIFLFNGFYAHRMLVGHYGYQSFMLIPLVAYLLMHRHKHQIASRTTVLFGIYAGTLIGYWFHSGLTTLMVPAALSVVSLAIIAALRTGNPAIIKTFIARGLIASLIAIGLSLSKLNANLALMSNFARDYYPLPGIGDPAGLATFIFQALFYSSEHAFQTATPLWQNMQWSAMPHELAYGLTPLPLLPILVGGSMWLLKNRPGISTTPKYLNRLIGFTLILILSLPIALLIYTPEWNAILKKIPLIDSTTSPFRWMIIYIPIIATLSGICTEYSEKIKFSLCASIVLGTPLLNSLEQRDFYSTQSFDPSAYVRFYNQLKIDSINPKIQKIADPKNPQGDSIVENSLFLEGSSPIHCYNPIFGYRLEKLNTYPLIEGSITRETAERTLNLHNPACLVFPKENECKPWDAFKLDQLQLLFEFASYKTYVFKKSSRQHISDTISLITLLLCLGAFVMGLTKNLLPSGQNNNENDN